MPRVPDEYEIEVVWDGQSSRTLLEDYPSRRGIAFHDADLKFGIGASPRRKPERVHKAHTGPERQEDST